MQGTVLRFDARTTSLFHTSRKEFANLLKCAPFILGSTIRGAILDYLIRTHCKQDLLDLLQGMKDPRAVAVFHCNCLEPCPVKRFFDAKPLVWFSFAQFEAPDFETTTRIGMARDTRSVAEGSIFNMEAVSLGVGFTFRVFLFGEARQAENLVRDAVVQVGLLWGLGRGRSFGFGRFEVLNQSSTDFECVATDRRGEFPPPNNRLEMTFETPLVLGDPTQPTPMRSDLLGQYIAEQICRVASTIREAEMQPMTMRAADVRLHPEFVGRFSYERGLRENRLVAWQGSSVVLDLEGAEDTDQLAVASVLGIGPWNDWGFGRFSLARHEEEFVFPDPNGETASGRRSV